MLWSISGGVIIFVLGMFDFFQYNIFLSLSKDREVLQLYLSAGNSLQGKVSPDGKSTKG